MGISMKVLIKLELLGMSYLFKLTFGLFNFLEIIYSSILRK